MEESISLASNDYSKFERPKALKPYLNNSPESTVLW